MVPIIIAAIVIGFIIIMVRRNKVSTTPEYLRGKHLSKYIDEITGRSVWIASYKNEYGTDFVVEAFYADDDSVCEKALFRQAYGFMLYEDGKLSVVRRSYALDILDKFVRNREEKKRLKQQNISKNSKKEIINDEDKGEDLE